MTKLTPKKKAKRRAGRIERKAAKQQRKDSRERTKNDFDSMASLEQRNEPEDFSQAAARIVKEGTKG
jgi:hypothetical protein